MILITIALIVSTTLGTPLDVDNAKLRKTNQVLLNALRELQVGGDEVQVGGMCLRACAERYIGDGYCDEHGCDGCDSYTTNGCFDGGDCGDCGPTPAAPAQESNQGADPFAKSSANAANCGELTAYKKCTGSGFKVDDWSRSNFGYSPVTEFNDGQAEAFCQQRCDNFGVPGCCEYQMDHDICYFYPGTMSTKDDPGVDQHWNTKTRQMQTWPKRHSSICNIPNCEYNMVSMTPPLTTGSATDPSSMGLCDYRNEDKFGYRVTKVRGGQQECNGLCLADPTCYVAAYRSGECNRFTTCSQTFKDSKGTLSYAQKVCKGAEEECNVPMPAGLPQGSPCTKSSS